MIDAERKLNLKKVLSDAVPMLCRSGLGVYNSEISVEALIGITINSNELVLISFNELMTAEGDTVSHTWRKCESPDSDVQALSESECPRECSRSASLKTGEMKGLRNDSEVDVDLANVNNCYDGLDADGVCYIDNSEWNDEVTSRATQNETSSGKRRRKNRTTSEKNSSAVKHLSTNRHALEDCVEGISFVGQSSGPITPRDVKIEPREMESRVYVKVENGMEDYGFDSELIDATNLESAILNHSRKRSRQRGVPYENFEVPVGSKQFGGNVSHKTVSRHTQRHLQTRHSGGTVLEDLAELQSSHSMLAVDFQGSQSTASTLASSGALLPYPLDQHRPEPIPPTASQFAPKKRCRVCYARKVRKEVRFCCSACPDRPGLCLSPCFYEFHEVFVMPKFFQQGTVSKHGRGSVSERRNSVDDVRPDLPCLSDMPGEAGQPPDS